MKEYNAGPVSVHYDNGFLRRIAYGETEIVRMIYHALRDHNWNTISHAITNENVVIDGNNFTITYDCSHIENDRDVIKWQAKIEGKDDGTITFEIAGTVMRDFKKNRAGFCVLHPLNVTSTECQVTHPDHTLTVQPFPADVAADNPFKNIQSMTWPAAGTRFNLSFEGDIFETEDQRNWGDASFKTFCTPLDKPFPVELKKGQQIFQRITFKPESPLGNPEKRLSYISLRDNGASSKIPAIGIGASTEVSSLSGENVLLLRALNLSHYRIDLTPSEENWVVQFSKEYERAYALGLPLEVALHLTDNYREETEGFVLLCQQNKVKVKKVLLLRYNAMATDQNLIEYLPGLKSALPTVAFGAGTNYNFNELNKNRFNPGLADFISFSMDPQEHAVDDLTVLENTETMAYLVNSARAIYGKSMPVHISPITLRKRYNPYATDPRDLFIEESKKADPRQKETFAAIWTFGTICSLTRAGAEALTCYQTIGNQGLLSEDGVLYPVYHTLKTFASLRGKSARVLESTDPLKVQAILIDDKILGLANLADQENEVRIAGHAVQLGAWEIKFEVLDRAQHP